VNTAVPTGERGVAVLIRTRLLAAADAATACGYEGLAASFEHIEAVLTALPAPHAQRIAEAISTGPDAGSTTASTRGTRR